MRELTMIRHGLTEGVEKRWYYGAADLPLTAAGRAQLAEKKAAGIYPDAAGKQLITTHMLRARETTEILYPGLHAEIIPELREVDFGEFECKHYEDLKDTEAFQNWLAGDWYRVAPPGGESYAEAETRVLAAMETLFRRDGDAVIVAHGGTIIVTMEHLFPEAHKTQPQWCPEPGCGWQVDLQAHTFRKIG